MSFVLEAVDSKHLEETFCCTFPLDPSATWPACLSGTSPPVLSGFGQLSSNHCNPNQDEFQEETIGYTLLNAASNIGR